jgi:hypothetical protein
MSTQAALIAEILSDTERGAGETSAIRSKIAAAIRHYQPTRFWFNESRDATFNTVVDQSDYAFGTAIVPEFYTVDGLFLTEGTNVYDLRPADYRGMEILLDANTTSALPVSFAYINRKLRVYPYPDAVYPVRVTGHVKIAVPAADDTAGNEWFTEAYDLIMSRAKAELYAHRWEDANQAMIMRAAEQDAFSRLVSTTNAKVGTGTIRPTQF